MARKFWSFESHLGVVFHRTRAVIAQHQVILQGQGHRAIVFPEKRNSAPFIDQEVVDILYIYILICVQFMLYEMCVYIYISLYYCIAPSVHVYLHLYVNSFSFYTYILYIYNLEMTTHNKKNKKPHPAPCFFYDSTWWFTAVARCSRYKCPCRDILQAWAGEAHALDTGGQALVCHKLRQYFTTSDSGFIWWNCGLKRKKKSHLLAIWWTCPGSSFLLLWPFAAGLPDFFSELSWWKDQL